MAAVSPLQIEAALSSPTLQHPGDHAAPAGMDAAPESPEPELPATARPSQLVLTPSRLRIDSRVLLAHTTSQWLMNSLFGILLLLKVKRTCPQCMHAC